MTKNGRTIREKVLALLRAPDYRPRDRNEIARELGLKGRERVSVRKTLRELENGGEIVRIRKNRYVLPSEADLVTGKLSIHQAGYGFLVPEKAGEPDVFIAAENTGTAMTGDRVVARISRDVPPRRAKVRAGQPFKPRSEGRVIRILERARDTIVGTLQHSRNFYYVVPDDPRLVHDVYVQVPPREKLPKAPTRGEIVVVRLEAWESRHVNPEGEIIEVLGAATAPGIDMLSIVRKYDLPTAFPKSVIDEANRIPQSVEQRMVDGREDLRDQFIVTIDPDDARDFDDAIDVEKIDNEGWRLGVHIADVSAYVTPDSALDLELPEVKVYVDPAGKPIRLERVENDESHQLIEEFMLAANEAVARELRQRSIATIYRVHEDPDPEKLAEYREFVLSFNHKVGDLSHRKEVQRFLASIRGKPEEQALKIGLLKSLKRARYAAQSLGHYGLAKANYLHFTSPIRRYADLVVHRTLAERNSPRRSKIDVGQIESLANHISDTERNAAEAEIESVRLKKLQFFQEQLEQRNPQVFRAAIMDVRNYGLVVELPDALVTGVVHVSTLGDDFYIFDAAQRRLIGRGTRRRFSVGDEIRVFVARVDTFKRQIDFAIADQVSRKSPRRR